MAAVEVLDLTEPTVQTSDTACWLLSTIEGLRSGGHLQALLARDVVVQEGGWQTSAGTTGRVIGNRGLPRWQQVLESVFSGRHPGSRRRGFQEQVPPAFGMGMKGRAAAIESYFQLISTNIRVSCSMITPRIGLPAESMVNFLGSKTNAGKGDSREQQTVRVLVAQTNFEDCERAHAIAVHASAFDGKRLVLQTYDQKFGEAGKYTVRCGATAKQSFALPTCPWKDGTPTKCDGVVKVAFEGLP